MRGYLALALTCLSFLASSPSLAATYSHTATFQGMIQSAYCTEPCEDDNIFGIPSSDLKYKSYQIDVSYFVSNVSRALSSGNSYVSYDYIYWDELLSVSTTINGVTVTALGTGTGLWVYNDCACFYSNEDGWGYRSRITAEANGTPLAFELSLSNYARPGRIPADGPLFSSFGVSTWFGTSAVSFSIGGLRVHSFDTTDSARFQAISPVPLPASLPLMTTALIAAFAFLRRRKAGSLAGRSL